MAHSSILGGSTAARVLNCPASVRLSKDIPEPPPSSYALEGTALHAVMEVCVSDDEAPTTDLIGQEIAGLEITAEIFADKIMPAWEATMEAFKRLDVVWVEAEAQVVYTPVKDSFGTCDIIAGGRDNTIVLLDYKFGHNIVSPVENAQLMFYALAMMHDPEYRNEWSGEPSQAVMLGIIQPNDQRETALWTWQTTAGDLTKFDLSLRKSAMIATDATFHPEPMLGDWCKWCRAAAVCPAKLSGATAVNRLKQEHLNDLSVALALAEELEPWIKSVKTLAHEQLERGDKIEGWKLVAKRAIRKWKDGTDLMAKLKNSKKLKAHEYLKETVLTAPQLEKIFKAKKLDFKAYAEYIETRSSGTTMAPADDPRPAIEVAPATTIPENMK